MICVPRAVPPEREEEMIEKERETANERQRKRMRERERGGERANARERERERERARERNCLRGLPDPPHLVGDSLGTQGYRGTSLIRTPPPPPRATIWSQAVLL